MNIIINKAKTKFRQQKNWCQSLIYFATLENKDVNKLTYLKITIDNSRRIRVIAQNLYN